MRCLIAKGSEHEARLRFTGKRNSPPCRKVCSLILNIQQFHLRKSHSPRHRHHAGAIQTNLIVKLPAQLFSFIEFYRRVGGKMARIGHVRFEASKMFRKRANMFESKQGLLDVM